MPAIQINANTRADRHSAVCVGDKSSDGIAVAHAATPMTIELAQIIVVRIDPTQASAFAPSTAPAIRSAWSQWRGARSRTRQASSSTPTSSMRANFTLGRGRQRRRTVARRAAYTDHDGGQLRCCATASPILTGIRKSLAAPNTRRRRTDQLIQGFPMLVDGGDSRPTSRRDQWRPKQRGARSSPKTTTGEYPDHGVRPILGLSLSRYERMACRDSRPQHRTRAVNLDGGGSTMIALPDASMSSQPSLDAVPVSSRRVPAIGG